MSKLTWVVGGLLAISLLQPARAQSGGRALGEIGKATGGSARDIGTGFSEGISALLSPQITPRVQPTIGLDLDFPDWPKWENPFKSDISEDSQAKLVSIEDEINNEILDDTGQKIIINNRSRKTSQEVETDISDNPAGFDIRR